MVVTLGIVETILYFIEFCCTFANFCVNEIKDGSMLKYINSKRE